MAIAFVTLIPVDTIFATLIPPVTMSKITRSICLAQTIVAHATSRGIQIDGIDIDVEGDVDLRGFTGISSEVRPGAQQFRVNMNIKSTNASKEQINELQEIGKRFSPAFDTLTNGTSVVLVNYYHVEWRFSDT